MKLHYFDSAGGIRLDDDTRDYSPAEALAFLRRLRSPGACMISGMPSAGGVDFHVESDGKIWIEIYAHDGLFSATVAPAIAEQVFERALASEAYADTNSLFIDLIGEWDSYAKPAATPNA